MLSFFGVFSPGGGLLSVILPAAQAVHEIDRQEDHQDHGKDGQHALPHQVQGLKQGDEVQVILWS